MRHQTAFSFLHYHFKFIKITKSRENCDYKRGTLECYKGCIFIYKLNTRINIKNMLLLSYLLN